MAENKTNFNVTDFIGAMKHDGLRPNLFEITLDGAESSFKFKAKASSIPKSSIGVVGTHYFGRPVTFAGNRSFDPWGISILMDETDYGENGIRSYFEKWMNNINGNYTNIRSNQLYPTIESTADTTSTSTSYYKNGQVIHYGKNGKPLATYTMWGCFPVDVSAMPLDWGGNNSISEFSVTLVMQWWERASTSPLDKSLKYT